MANKYNEVQTVTVKRIQRFTRSSPVVTYRTEKLKTLKMDYYTSSLGRLAMTTLPVLSWYSILTEKTETEWSRAKLSIGKTV